MKNLKPGEAVITIDYKMKLELSMHASEIQKDWYGKRGISLHGFYVIAQIAVDDFGQKIPNRMPGSRKVHLM